MIVFIIIKTYKNLISELISIHKTEEDASHNLNKLSDHKFINRIINGTILKVYENNYFMKNNSLYIYQIIKINENGDMKKCEHKKKTFSNNIK